MSDTRNYYYMRLKENFYESEELIILQSMQDGYLYSDILMKLYLRSLKNEGKLIFKDYIPYNPTMLAQIVRHSVGVVEKALEIFQKLNLIEVLNNGTIFMLDIQNFIGKCNTEADRKRIYRNKIDKEKNKLLENRTNVPSNVHQRSLNSSPEIEIELEKEIDLEIDLKIENKLKEKNMDANRVCESDDSRDNNLSKSSIPYKQIVDMYHQHLSEYLPNVRLPLPEYRKQAIKVRCKTDFPTLQDWDRYFSKVAMCPYLLGLKPNYDGSYPRFCNFDWLLKPKNITKILDGNYLPTGGDVK